MTQLSEKAIKEFQELVYKKRGIKLSYDEAGSMALDWLEFFKFVFRPIPGVDYGKKKEKGTDQISKHDQASDQK